MTLEAGDIVTTGSPEGVASVKDGDTLRIEIERLGGFTVGVEAM
jgi:2-keto-4-pentenoate hydratase/2-oxohepta-3-ene-1,7-dioic acid hydratase in catechol pathway